MSPWIFFYMCQLYPPLTNIVDFHLSQLFFHSFHEGSKFLRGTFHPKNDPQKKKNFFFFTEQIRLKNNCLRVFFLLWAHYTLLSPLLWISICLSFFFVKLLYGQKFSRAICNQKMSLKEKRIFFADQSRLKNKCLHELFLICAHYTPL